MRLRLLSLASFGGAHEPKLSLISGNVQQLHIWCHSSDGAVAALRQHAVIPLDASLWRVQGRPLGRVVLQRRA